MSWFSHISSEDKLSAIAGMVLFGITFLGAIEMINTRSTLPASCVTNTNNTNSCTSGSVGTQKLGNLTLEDIGINNNYHYTFEVITVAEDPEYWEIEQLGGNFYRVRREDYDDNYYGKYEFDCEELIGDVEDLYKYAKEHNIIPR